MTKPSLYVFTISHYCEKARWALDYLGVDYQLEVVAPGTHLNIARKLGLKYGSVPFLKDGDTVIQGSDQVISWAEEHSASNKTLGSDNEQVMEIEKRLDDKLGIHVRRWYYSEAIVNHPATVKPVFMKDISAIEKMKLAIKWPVIQKLMINKMNLGPKQGLESLDIVKQEIKWLESLLSDNTSFLVGDQLSRADITAASLIAPVVSPPEHSAASIIKIPPGIEEQLTQLQDFQIWPWVTHLYRTYRK